MREILKAGFKVGMATMASLLGWVVAGKVLAHYFGASGVGLFGLLRQLLQNLALVGSFNGTTALVQGIASRSTPERQLRYARHVRTILIVLSGSLACILLIGAPWIAPILVPHPNSVILLRWLVLAMVMMVAQNYALGILNGHRLVDALVRSQTKGPLTVLALIPPMIWLVKRGYPSGYILMLGAPALAVALFAMREARRAGLGPVSGRSPFAWADTASFFRMSVVLLVTGLVGTGTQYFLSWTIARRMGLAQAGQFWTAWTLSMSYVTLVLGSLGTYYMPSLSRLTDPAERNALIRQYLKLSIIAMPVLVSVVVVFKPWVILGMFSSALFPALKVMRWMLIGDYFKGLAWVLAFPMLAFSEIRWFFWTEVLFNIGLAGIAWAWLITGGGLEGLGGLFMLAYLLYLPVMVFYIWRMHGFIWEKRELQRAGTGLALVVGLSALTWCDQRVTLNSTILWIIVSACYLGLVLKETDLRFLAFWKQRLN